MGILPVLAKGLVQVMRPFPIHHMNPLFDVDARAQPAPQAAYALAKRRIHKHVKRVLLLLQNALRPAAHNHAIAFLMRLLHNLARHLRHYIAVETVFIRGSYPGRQRCTQHRLPIQPSHPRLRPLIVPRHNRWIDMRRARNRRNQFAVNQPPAQLVRHNLRNPSPTAAKLPRDRQNPVRHRRLHPARRQII